VDCLVGVDEEETCSPGLVGRKYAWGGLVGSGLIRLAINALLVKRRGCFVRTDEVETCPAR